MAAKIRDTSPDALADWAIWTGRLPLNARGAFLAAFEADPTTALADVLAATPTRPAKPRRCPLFEADPVVGERVQRGHGARKVRRAATTEIVAKAVSATVAAVADPHDPKTRENVTAALTALARREVKTTRKAVRVRATRRDEDIARFGFSIDDRMDGEFEARDLDIEHDVATEFRRGVRTLKRREQRREVAT